jgi:hypothetical protein
MLDFKMPSPEKKERNLAAEGRALMLDYKMLRLAAGAILRSSPLHSGA